MANASLPVATQQSMANDINVPQPMANVTQGAPVHGNEPADGNRITNNYVARPPVQTHFYITRVEDIPADLTWKFGSNVEFSRSMAPSVHVWYAAFGVKAHLEVRKTAMSIGLPRLLEADWGRIEMFYAWAVSQGKGRKFANGNNVSQNHAIVCGPGDQYLVKRLQIVEVPLEKEIPDAAGSPDILETIDLLDLVVRSNGSPRPRARLLAIGDINLCRQVLEQVETARFHFNADADRLTGQNALLAGRRTQRVSFSVKNPWCAYTRIQNWSMKDLPVAEMNQILRRQVGIKLYARGIALPAGFGVHIKKGRVVQHRNTIQNMPQAARNEYFIANHLGRLFTPVVLEKVVFLEVYKPGVNSVVMTQEPQPQEQVPMPRPPPELPLAVRFGNAVLDAAAVDQALDANQEQQPTANDESYEFLDSECGSEFELIEADYADQYGD
uniref:Polyprotein n=1 Tax=Acrobeloides nanus TaxID=290746 RepID=A0A914E1L2_9BILA